MLSVGVIRVNASGKRELFDCDHNSNINNKCYGIENIKRLDHLVCINEI